MLKMLEEFLTEKSRKLIFQGNFSGKAKEATCQKTCGPFKMKACVLCLNFQFGVLISPIFGCCIEVNCGGKKHKYNVPPKSIHLRPGMAAWPLRMLFPMDSSSLSAIGGPSASNSSSMVGAEAVLRMGK
eukprot:EG_transcript_46157